MVWWQQTIVWSGQTIVERRNRCRWLVAANDSLVPANNKMIRCGKREMRLAHAFVGDFNPLSATG